MSPKYAKAYNGLALALQRLGKGEEAVGYLKKAVESNPRYGTGYFNLAGIYRELGRNEAAMEAVDEALRIDPNCTDTLIRKGVILLDEKKTKEALKVLRCAAAAEPDNAEVQLQLARAYLTSYLFEEAKEACDESVRLDPGDGEARKLLDHICALTCDWKTRQANLPRLMEMIEEEARSGRNRLAPPFSALSFLFTPEKQLATARLWSKKISKAMADLRAGFEKERREAPHTVTDRNIEHKKTVRRSAPSTSEQPITGGPGAPHTVSQEDSEHQGSGSLASELPTLSANQPGLAPRPHRRNARRICLAYLSYNFRNHATSHLIQGLFTLHDRSEFEIFAYSMGPDDGSDYRKRIEREADQFIDIATYTYSESAKRIHEDQIDILVDLIGYAANGRPEITAQRPAPVTVSFLGYPATTGADFVDYLVADRIVVPPGSEKWYAENLVFMPHCYQVNDHKQLIAEKTPTRGECGLPEEGFIFCCFNGSQKINREIFEIWMRILKTVPESVLWLYQSNRLAAKNLRREAEARSVEGSRLVFAESLPKPEHLARHRLAGLFIDTLIYNAHTTGTDALWTGLPIITLQGETFESRVAASLLTAVGMPELIMPDLETYEDTAIRLAKNPEELQAVREKLVKNRTTTPLFDTPRWARNWEKALKMIWEQYERGEEPGEIVVEE